MVYKQKIKNLMTIIYYNLYDHYHLVLYGYLGDFQSINFDRAKVMIYDSINDILYDVN